MTSERSTHGVEYVITVRKDGVWVDTLKAADKHNAVLAFTALLNEFGTYERSMAIALLKQRTAVRV